MQISMIFSRQNIKNAVFVVVGCLISAIGVNMFLINESYLVEVCQV